MLSIQFDFFHWPNGTYLNSLVYLKRFILWSNDFSVSAYVHYLHVICGSFFSVHGITGFVEYISGEPADFKPRHCGPVAKQLKWSSETIVSDHLVARCNSRLLEVLRSRLPVPFLL